MSFSENFEGGRAKLSVLFEVSHKNQGEAGGDKESFPEIVQNIAEFHSRAKKNLKEELVEWI